MENIDFTNAITFINKLSIDLKDPSISKIESRVDGLKKIITELNFCKDSIKSLDSSEFKEKSILTNSKESQEDIIKNADNVIEKINNILLAKILMIEKFGVDESMIFFGLSQESRTQLDEILTREPLLVNYMPELVDPKDKAREILIKNLAKFSPEALSTVTMYSSALFNDKMNSKDKISILDELIVTQEKSPELIEVICNQFDNKMKTNERCIIISLVVKFPHLFEGLTSTEQRQLRHILTQNPELVDQMPGLVDHNNKARGDLINCLSKFTSSELSMIPWNDVNQLWELDSTGKVSSDAIKIATEFIKNKPGSGLWQKNKNIARFYFFLVERIDFILNKLPHDVIKEYARLLTTYPDLLDWQTHDSPKITIDTGVKQFLIPKNHLVLSDKFFSRLNLNAKESKEQKITLNMTGFEENVISAFLNFLSTGEIKLTEENVMDLFILADQHIIPILKNECLFFIRDNITQLGQKVFGPPEEIVLKQVPSDNFVEVVQFLCRYMPMKLTIAPRTDQELEKILSHISSLLTQDIENYKNTLYPVSIALNLSNCENIKDEDLFRLQKILPNLNELHIRENNNITHIPFEKLTFLNCSGCTSLPNSFKVNVKSEL